MAYTYGSYVGPGGAQRMRVGYEIVSISPASPSPSTTQVTVRVRVAFMTAGYGVYDVSNLFAITGDISKSSSAVIDNGSGGALPGGQERVIDDFTVNFSLVRGSTQTKTFTVSLSGVDAIGSGYTAQVAGSVVIPARPYDAPAAPSGLVVTRVSDSQQTLSWSRNATADAPYSSQQVRRRTRIGTSWGSWSTIATVAGTAQSYTDNTTIADRDYEFAIVAVNATGTATSAAARIQTTPAAPSALAAAKTAGGDIEVTLTPASQIAACEYELYHSTDGGANWSLLDTLAPGELTFLHTSPSPSDSHTYRARAVTPDVSLYSDYATSNTVQLLAPPAAPTTLSPNGGVVDASEDVHLTFEHTPADTTPMEQFQVRHREAGAVSWTEETEVSSDTALWTLPAGTYASGQTVEWQVRTWGAHADPSPWSATATIIMSTRPTVAISSPADASIVPDAQLTVEWTYYSAESQPQAAYRATLREGSTILEVATRSGPAEQATFATLLSNGGTYTVDVEVRDALGLWSLVYTATFDVEYLPPAPVVLLAEWDRATGRVYLTALPEGATEDETAEVVAIDIQRRIDGGEWVTTHRSMAADVSTYDPLPTTRGLNEYRAVGYSALGAVTVNAATPVEVNEQTFAYLNWGPAFSEVARLWASPTITSKSDRAKALEQFANADFPTLLAGRSRSRTLAVSARIETALTSPWEAWDEAGLDALVCAWRDPHGRRIEAGALAGGQSNRQLWARGGDVSFTITQVTA